MPYVIKKDISDSKTIWCAWGYTIKPGGLGPIPDGWEEIEISGPPPEDWQKVDGPHIPIEDRKAEVHIDTRPDNEVKHWYSKVSAYYFPSIKNAPLDMLMFDSSYFDIASHQVEIYRTRINSGISIRILQIGLIVFDFSDYEPGHPIRDPSSEHIVTILDSIIKRSYIFNAHLLCLYSAFFYCNPQNAPLKKYYVRPNSIFNINSFENLENLFTNIGSNSDYRNALQNIITSNTKSMNEILYIKDLKINRDILDSSFELLNSIIQTNSFNAIYLADLLMGSCYDFESYNYPLSLTKSWTASEKLMNLLIDKYYKNDKTLIINIIKGFNNKKVNKSNKEKLIRSFSNNKIGANAESLCRFLFLSGKIPLWLYKRLTNARRYRNIYLHSLQDITRDMAGKAFIAAEELYTMFYGVEINVPLGADTVIYIGQTLISPNFAIRPGNG